MATGKHYRSGKAPARQPQKSVDDALYNYRVEAAPQSPAPRTAQTAPQVPARSASARAKQQPARKKKKSVVIPILAVLLILAALGIFAYILWDLGVFGSLLGMLS